MRFRSWLCACAVMATLAAPAAARATSPAWCPVPSVPPIGGWFWFVPCAWVPSPHPWAYSVDTQLPAAAAIDPVWFSIGNHNPWVPNLHVRLLPLWPVGQELYYAGCDQGIAGLMDWFSIAWFTAMVGVPGALPVPTPPYQFKVGMTGYCPN